MCSRLIQSFDCPGFWERRKFLCNGPAKIIISRLIWCLLIFYFIVFIAFCSIIVFREIGITVIILFLFLFVIVFHHNPSFSVLGPTIVTGHETGSQKVAVNETRDGVSTLVDVGDGLGTTVHTIASRRTFEFDMVMFIFTPGGKERGLSEFQELSRNAGFVSVEATYICGNAWAIDFIK
ncbi:hypothetical protein QYE76_048280 [Lolium multiflorum]|uniref:Uncharacterized protein n=1 Tax=Lolium multiflorum TaxID=4521 RepID=A0AAD8QGV9_LOLMU|nr:hypothetical protein QYE76_048280 [Lolium multiflorum]